MPELILHHYAESPYAEKIRRILGFKNLTLRSVGIPMVMPKPDLLALTGGYRKTPVLQIGADIYCDTDLIARTLEHIAPEPTLFPPGSESLAYMLGPWQQQLFTLAVYQIGTSAPVFPPGFVEDRSQMVEHPYALERILADIGPQRDQLRAKLDYLDRRVAAQPFVLGEAPSLADFALFHPVYALKLLTQTAPLLAPHAHVRAWVERIERFGHGTFTELGGADAVAIARASVAAAGGRVDPNEASGLRLGQRVEIVHEDFGRDPTVGELVASSAHEIAVRREDSRAGTVVVHLPREHYLVRPAR
jgi:glutathione S-transferase